MVWATSFRYVKSFEKLQDAAFRNEKIWDIRKRGAWKDRCSVLVWIVDKNILKTVGIDGLPSCPECPGSLCNSPSLMSGAPPMLSRLSAGDVGFVSSTYYVCMRTTLSLSSSFSLCQGWGAACNFFTPSSASLFHPPLSPVFFFQSPSSPAFFTSLFTQSSHLSIGFPRLLLPCSRNSAALFGSLSSAILSACPAHCNLLRTSLSVKLFCTPVSSLDSTVLRLYALVTLAIFFGPNWFRTLAAFVVVVRSVPMFPFRTGMPVWHKCSWPCSSVFLRSAGPPLPPQLLSTRSLRPGLFDVPLSPSSRLRTLPLLGTRNCPVGSVSSPPARCPALPFGGLCAALPSSMN